MSEQPHSPDQIVVLRGLEAHFKQPDGSSKAGTDWAVAVRDEARVHQILVRVYKDGFGQIERERETSMVVEFVAGLLRQGWTPDQWTGCPGELTLPHSLPKEGTPVRDRKPWWRFW
jgi:hypothetical protein